MQIHGTIKRDDNATLNLEELVWVCEEDGSRQATKVNLGWRNWKGQIECL